MKPWMRQMAAAAPRRTVTHTTNTTRALVLTLSAAVSGCFFGTVPIPAPAVPLDKAEQRKVVACQDMIAKQAQLLQTTTVKQLHRCAALGLDLALDEERELDTSTLLDFEERRADAREKCDAAFAKVGKASTKMIDAVVAKCTSLEGLILHDPTRGDPLGLKHLDTLSTTGASLDTMADLASQACGMAVAAGELVASYSYLRIGDLSWRYFGIESEEDLRIHWQASLDPRCLQLSFDL